ncbi:hypothetical protein OSTOST_08633, partial [Ostertagia ostertagi]
MGLRRTVSHMGSFTRLAVPFPFLIHRTPAPTVSKPRIIVEAVGAVFVTTKKPLKQLMSFGGMFDKFEQIIPINARSPTVMGQARTSTVMDKQARKSSVKDKRKTIRIATLNVGTLTGRACRSGRNAQRKKHRHLRITGNKMVRRQGEKNWWIQFVL